MGSIVRGMLKFNRGIMRVKLWIRLWIGLLVVANLVVPLLFWAHVEARVILGTFAVAGTLMGALTARFGFARILGLGHFVWFPLFAYLIPRFGLYPASEPFGLYLRALVAVNLAALAFDVNDVVRYARGEREEMVAGL